MKSEVAANEMKKKIAKIKWNKIKKGRRDCYNNNNNNNDNNNNNNNNNNNKKKKKKKKKREGLL